MHWRSRSLVDADVIAHVSSRSAALASLKPAGCCVEMSQSTRARRARCVPNAFSTLLPATARSRPTFSMTSATKWRGVLIKEPHPKQELGRKQFIDVCFRVDFAHQIRQIIKLFSHCSCSSLALARGAIAARHPARDVEAAWLPPMRQSSVRFNGQFLNECFEVIHCKRQWGIVAILLFGRSRLESSGRKSGHSSTKRMSRLHTMS